MCPQEVDAAGDHPAHELECRRPALLAHDGREEGEAERTQPLELGEDVALHSISRLLRDAALRVPETRVEEDLPYAGRARSLDRTLEPRKHDGERVVTCDRRV